MATKKKVAKKKLAKKKVTKKKTTAKKASAKKKVTATKKVAKKVAKKSAKKTVKKKVAAKKATSKKKTTAKPTTVKKGVKAKTPKSNSAKTTIAKKKAKAVKASAKPAKPAKPAKAKKKADPKLTSEVLKIRERLIVNRVELLKLIQASQSVERDVGDLTFSNEIDLASSLEGREMIFQLTSRDRNELKLIDDTLIRISSGTYGECESCEKKISLKRLQIMPLTSMCIECQEAAENL